MRNTILIAISLLACLFLISGCGTETAKNETIQNSDNMTPIENITLENAAEEAEETPAVEENRTAEENQALIEELMKEKGLDEETAEEEPEEETPTNFTIEIIYMRGEPEKDLDIEAGNSVTWISRQPNYVHRLQIRIKSDTGVFKEYMLDEPASLEENDSFTYTFENAGIYQWLSLTNFPTTQGIITVE
jgi:plastocyanin